MPTIEDLVKLLGLGIEEEFCIYDNRLKEQVDWIYKFSHHNLLYYANGTWSSSVKDILDFFTGAYTIIKKPWKPKRFERYYYISADGEIERPEWENDFLDLTLYATGNCFKTQKEAEEHITEIREQLEKIYDSGKPLISVAKEQDK